VTILERAGRVGLAVSALALAAIVAIQYEGIIVRNFSMSHELAASRSETAALREKRRKQLRQIQRLSDPRGSIPEIHDRLHLVTPHEELIYLKGVPTASPENPEGQR
jgi:hypothetical protein